jgi:hypothetical protein
MTPARKDPPEAGWPAVVASILATPPRRPGTSRPAQVVAGAAADPHEHDWAGPGFTKPGPEPDTGQQARNTPADTDELADTPTISDDPTAPLTGRRDAPSRPVRRARAEGRTRHDRQR